MTRPQINWVLVPDSPVLSTDEDLAKRYPKPVPESPETLAAMKLKADSSPPSEVDISHYSCALIDAGDLREALQYAELLAELVPESRVAEALKIYIAELERGGDESTQLRKRVAHSKRLYRAVNEDLIARMTPQQRYSDQRLLAAKARGTEALLAEARTQLKAHAADIRHRFNLAGDLKMEFNPFTIWRNRKLARELKRLERAHGADAVANRLPILVDENPTARALYTAGIEFYITVNRFPEALALTNQARARFPRIVHFELCEEGLQAIIAAPTVERKEQQKVQLESDLTALRWALLSR